MEPEWVVQAAGRKCAGEYGYSITDWVIKEKGAMFGEGLIAIVPNGVTDVEEPKEGSVEMAKRIQHIRELMQIVKEVACCLYENDDNGAQTHYVRVTKNKGDSGDTMHVLAKGSFIDLVQRAHKLAEDLSIDL